MSRAFFDCTLGGSCRGALDRRALDNRAFDRLCDCGDYHFRDGRRQHADYWVIGIEDRLDVAGELDRRDVNDVVNIDVGHINLDRVGNFQRQAFDRSGARQRRQYSAVGETFGLARELERHFDANRPVEIDLVQIRVQDLARHRRALHVLENYVLAVDLRSARLELDDAGVRGRRNPGLQFQPIDRQGYRRGRGSVQYRGHAAIAPQRVVLTLGSGGAFLAG